MNDSLEESTYYFAEKLKPYIAKSYLEEKTGLMQDALECCICLEDLLDMDGMEAGKWSIDDEEWLLKEGKTVDDAITLILQEGLMAKRGIIKSLSTLKLGSEGYFSRQDGKAFSSFILLEMPPVRLIEKMLDYDYLSLFECIFLVGYYTDNSGIISHSIDIASQAIMSGVIAPRDPETHLKLKDSPKQRLTGEAVLPDLSWLLSFDEAEQWAITNFDLSFKAVKGIFKEPPSAEAQKHPDHTESFSMDTKTDKPLDPRERQTLLAIVAALCKKQGISPCDKGLASELEKITDSLEIKRSAKAIKEHLDKAGLFFQ